MIEFARDVVGRPVDDAQALILRGSMGVGADGYWAARHVGICMPRQNGKTYLLALRALYGAIVLEEPLVVHTAQRMAIAGEQQRFIDELIATTPALKAEHLRTDYGAGRESHEFRNGSRILYKARNAPGGQNFRGPSVACVIFDEAAFLTQDDASAALYAASAKPFAQFWYAGTAPDQVTMPNSVAWARIRAAAHREAVRRAWFMWRAYDVDHPADVTPEMAADVGAWMRANPALGRRIRVQDVLDELEADPLGFVRERLGNGDWPSVDEDGSLVVPLEAWASCEDRESVPLDPVWLAFDVSPDRSRAAVAIGALRADSLAHVEVIEHFRSGISGLVPFLAERYRLHGAAGVVCDSAGGAAALRPELEALGVQVTMTSTPEFVGACGAMHDAAVAGTFRHRGQPLELEALRATTKRRLGDRWAWDRSHSNGDITPFVADTLALWAARNIAPPLPPDLMFPSQSDMDRWRTEFTN